MAGLFGGLFGGGQAPTPQPTSDTDKPPPPAPPAAPVPLPPEPPKRMVKPDLGKPVPPSDPYEDPKFKDPYATPPAKEESAGYTGPYKLPAPGTRGLAGGNGSAVRNSILAALTGSSNT